MCDSTRFIAAIPDFQFSTRPFSNGSSLLVNWRLHSSYKNKSIVFARTGGACPSDRESRGRWAPDRWARRNGPGWLSGRPVSSDRPVGPQVGQSDLEWGGQLLGRPVGPSGCCDTRWYGTVTRFLLNSWIQFSNSKKCQSNRRRGFNLKSRKAKRKAAPTSVPFRHSLSIEFHLIPGPFTPPSLHACLFLFSNIGI
ncbi:hypothetical protein J6590_076054 [Homalodisca vitripennis]|nr:hypothetical protein J6590_076054 [Homalodisca vitripennis]